MSASERKPEVDQRKLRSDKVFDPSKCFSSWDIRHILNRMHFKQLTTETIDLNGFNSDDSCINENSTIFRESLKKKILSIIEANLVNHLNHQRWVDQKERGINSPELIPKEKLADIAKHEAYAHEPSIITATVSDNVGSGNKQFVVHFHLNEPWRVNVPGTISMCFHLNADGKLQSTNDLLFSNSLILERFETYTIGDSQHKDLLIQLAELEENNRKIYENLKINDLYLLTLASAAFDNIRTNIKSWIEKPNPNYQNIKEAIEAQTIIRPMLIQAQFDAEFSIKPAEIKNQFINDFDAGLPAALKNMMNKIFMEAKNIAVKNTDFEQLHLLSQILESTRDLADRINQFSNTDKKFHKDMLKIKMENYKQLQEKIADYPNGKSVASAMLKVIGFIWSCTGIGYFAGGKQLLSKSWSMYYESRLAARMTELHAKTNEASKSEIPKRRSS